MSPPRLEEHSNILIGYYKAISGADIPISLRSPMDQQRDTISRSVCPSFGTSYRSDSRHVDRKHFSIVIENITLSFRSDTILNLSHQHPPSVLRPFSTCVSTANHDIQPAALQSDDPNPIQRYSCSVLQQPSSTP